MSVGPRLAFLLVLALLCRASPMSFGDAASLAFADQATAERGPVVRAPPPLEIERVVETDAEPRVSESERAPVRHPSEPRAALHRGRLSFGQAVVYARRGLGRIPPDLESLALPDRRATIRRQRVASDVPRGAHPPSDDPAPHLG